MNIVELAEQIATKAHEGQFRWDGKTPYIEHPRAVVNILKRKGYTDPMVLAVGYLHDTLEDSTLTRKDLENEFGTNIAAYVNILTRGVSERYADYIQNVAQHVLARIVKLADLEHNLSNLKAGAMRDKYELATLYLNEKVVD